MRYMELEFPPATALSPDHLHIWPRDQEMMIALPNLDGSFTVTLFRDDFELNDEQVTRLFTDLYPDTIKHFGSIERLLEQFRSNPVGRLQTVNVSQFHFGPRVAIFGDAAHAMVPFYGQGMNAGFEDISVLGELLLLDDSVDMALFTQKRLEDAKAICRMAMENYREMASLVTSTVFKFEQHCLRAVHRLAPGLVIPRYTMVSFTSIPYREVVRRDAWQRAVLYCVLVVISGSLVWTLLSWLSS